MRQLSEMMMEVVMVVVFLYEMKTMDEMSQVTIHE